MGINHCSERREKPKGYEATTGMETSSKRLQLSSVKTVASKLCKPLALAFDKTQFRLQRRTDFTVADQSFIRQISPGHHWRIP
jgi:hypothetical protein